MRAQNQRRDFVSEHPGNEGVLYSGLELVFFVTLDFVENVSDNFDRSHLHQPRSKTSKSEYRIPGKGKLVVLCPKVISGGSIGSLKSQLGAEQNSRPDPMSPREGVL